MCSLVTLFNILMDIKVRHLKKKSRQLGQVAPEKITHLRIHEFMFPKQNTLFFIPMKVQLITISSVIPYISGMNSTSSSLKTEKKISRKRKREGKRGRESAKEKEKEKEKEKKEEKEKKRE